MGDKSNPLPTAVTANSSSPNNNTASRSPFIGSEFIPQAPPPSYEESQREATSTQEQQKQPMGTPTAPSAPPSYGMATAQPFTQQYGYPNPYHMHMQQQHSFLQQHQPQQQTFVVYQPTQVGQNSVLHFDSSADVTRNANGAVIVPPPPPGCLPTAAQLAAMQGKQVLVQKKKKSFF